LIHGKKRENPDVDSDKHIPRTKCDITEKHKKFIESHEKLVVYVMFEKDKARYML
jgi:hypothetical protein